LKNEIEVTFNELVGKPLYSIGRTTNLVWLLFGEPFTKKNIIGDTRTLAEYSLHIQCAWRIVQKDKIIIASGDLYSPNSNVKLENFNWDNIGSSEFDSKASSLKKIMKDIRNVQSIEADNIGGLKICFSNNYLLEVFPNESGNDKESWRFFSNVSSSPYLVMCGGSIEENE